MSDQAIALYFKIRDFSYAGGLTIIMLGNLLVLSSYQFRKYLTEKNIYSLFSSHFYLNFLMILFELLSILRVVLFHTVTNFTAVQPFLNASNFFSDGLLMMIFLCMVWTWNKEYFKGDDKSCSSVSGVFFTKIIFVFLFSLGVALTVYFTEFSSDFDKRINVVFGAFFIIFFYACSGYYFALSFRIWRIATVEGETNRSFTVSEKKLKKFRCY